MTPPRNPLLFFQVSATVLPALLVAAAITLGAFKGDPEEVSPWSALIDALGVLSLGVGEATSLSVLKTGTVRPGATTTVSCPSGLALLVLMLELAGPRFLSFLSLLRQQVEGAGPGRRRRGWRALVALVVAVPAVLFLLFVTVLLVVA